MFFLLAFATTSALANEAHVFAFSFTGEGTKQLSGPTAVAVDNSGRSSEGDLYVTDSGNHRVEKFNENGEFLLMFGKEVNKTAVESHAPEAQQNLCTAASGAKCQAGMPDLSPGAFDSPTFVAVDGSSGPSAGDVYVGDPEQGRVSKFDSEGHLIATWGTDGELDFAHLEGIAVDPEGNLFVLDNTISLTGSATVHEYDPGGAELTSFPATLQTAVPGIAVDSSDDLYKTTGDAKVIGFDAASTEIGLIDDVQSAIGLAVDPSNEDLYVNQIGGFITQFAGGCPLPDCRPVASFGEGYLNEEDSTLNARGIAINSFDHTVYAINGRATGSEGGNVSVFYAPGILAEATTGASSQVGETSAMVTGQVDPAGAGAVTGCDFEYVDGTGFQESKYATAKVVPCEPATPYSSPTEVTASLPALQPGTIYHYRLVAANTKGSSVGVDRTFKTIILPAVTTDTITNLGRASATLTGNVNPAHGGFVFNCRFEFVENSVFRTSGYESSQAAPCSPPSPYYDTTGVSAELTGLREGTTYHYRLVAENSMGAGFGDDRTFSTLLAPEPSRHIRPKPVHHGPIYCSKTACSRTLDGSTRLQTWISPKFPRSYGWRFAVYRKGHSLPDTIDSVRCAGTFEGHGMIATLNGCGGRFKLTYLGPGHFSIRWRVFA